MRKLFYALTSIASMVAWVYAALERFGDKDWLMLAVDIVVPPVGVIDGIGLYFGFW